MCNFVHDLHAIVAKTCNDTCPLQPVAETGLAAGTYWGWRQNSVGNPPFYCVPCVASTDSKYYFTN